MSLIPHIAHYLIIALLTVKYARVQKHDEKGMVYFESGRNHPIKLHIKQAFYKYWTDFLPGRLGASRSNLWKIWGYSTRFLSTCDVGEKHQFLTNTYWGGFQDEVPM